MEKYSDIPKILQNINLIQVNQKETPTLHPQICFTGSYSTNSTVNNSSY